VLDKKKKASLQVKNKSRAGIRIMHLFLVHQSTWWRTVWISYVYGKITTHISMKLTLCVPAISIHRWESFCFYKSVRNTNTRGKAGTTKIWQDKKHEPHKNTVCTPSETRQIKCKNVKTCTTNVLKYSGAKIENISNTNTQWTTSKTLTQPH
jgi:hypothetical protein